jgi:hypothetical protein
MTNPKIKALVDSFTADLSGLIHEAAMASVQQALANFGMGGTKTKANAGKKRGRPVGSKNAPKPSSGGVATAAPKATKKKAGKRASKKSAGPAADPALSDKVASFVASKEGTGLGEIAKSVKAKKPAVQIAIRSLLDAGRIKKTGERKGTLYFGK